MAAPHSSLVTISSLETQHSHYRKVGGEGGGIVTLRPLVPAHGAPGSRTGGRARSWKTPEGPSSQRG